MRKTKRALLTSLLALLLCASMLTGTTFAWFTDSVTSGNNIIQSGNLDVQMFWTNDLTTDVWFDAEQTGAKAPFDYDLWEPGYTEVWYVQIVNAGNLALKYSLTLAPTGAVGKLAEVIGVYYAAGVSSNVADRSLSGMNSLGYLKDAMNGGEAAHGSLLPGQATIVAVALHMDEDAGNDYQNESIGDGFVFKLLATQMTHEGDSFGPDYDAAAKWPYVSIKYAVAQSIADKIDPTTGNLTEAVMIGNANNAQYAQIPADVKLADGADKLTFSITSMEKPKADVTTSTRDEILRSVDIHVDGIAEDNTVPMTFVLKEFFPKGLNPNNVKLYHVEGNETKEMTIVDAPVNHNEFSYDPLTGDAVITIATFSEVATYADTNGPWDGITYDYSWYKADGDLTIANANQFAAFRNIVDGVEINGVYTIDDFKGQKITLLADINLDGHNFDPIGWGYDNSAWNAGEADGKVFKGHFDGGNHTIYGLFQEGWELINEGTGKPYTYTNCGFGLFAAALDARFENLTIDGADIRVECVETGVLVGLAQGSCTFKNINILGCKAANYQRPVGGVVGEVSPKVENGEAIASTHTFENVYVDSNTVIGSLWGDFDAPVGGVIGAYWDDAGKTYVNMDGVTVACRLDVYNDVTSTYQWYAYRRAGMLIGNTDHSEKNENGTNIASTKINGIEHLTCSNVTVYYGEWADYHYCEFNKANPNWPWVRVEPGENCSGYSNPRWGRPFDSTTGQPVTDSVHEHGEGEGHLEPIPFHQLYGGGQGVYGAEKHENVSEGIYTVTYMDHGKVLRVDNVKDNSEVYTAPDIKTVISAAADGTVPAYWVDANGNKFTGIAAGRTANIIVYPKWPNEYTVRCLDTYGEVAYYNFVTDTDTSNYEDIAAAINNTLANIQNEVDKNQKVMIIVWEKADGSTITDVTATDIKNAVKNESDFILEAVPQLQTTSITLEKYYDPTTGELVAYHVTQVAQNDTNTSVIIPDYVGKIPVTAIRDSAAEGFKNLHAVTIPGTIEIIGDYAFAKATVNKTFGTVGKLETQTFYYDGSYEEFNAALQAHLNGDYSVFSEKWDSGLSENTRIFFLKEGKVDPSAGYWQLTEANIEKDNTGSFFSPNFVIVSEEYVWTYSQSVNPDFAGEYTGKCDCNLNHTRPDEAYWTGVFD